MDGPQFPVPAPSAGMVPLIGPAWVPPEHVPPARLLGVLARRKWLLAAVLLMVVPLSAYLIGNLPDYYDAQAEIMLNTRKAELRDLQATVETNDPDAITVGTQLGLIRSTAMASRVVDKLDLTHTPAFARLLDAPPPAWRLLANKFAGWMGIHGPAAAPARPEQRAQRAADILNDKVNVSNDGHSYIITIRARSSDPSLSAAIANAYSQIYLDFNRELKIAAIGRANALLDVQIAPLRDRVRLAEEAVETYRQKNGLVTGPGGGTRAQPSGTTVSEQQLAAINAQLTEATGELAADEANLRQIQDAVRNGSVDSLPEVVNSPLVATLRAQQAELGSSMASLGQTAMSGNPALRSATAGSADIQRRINAEIARIPIAAATKAAAARARAATLSASLDRLQGSVAGESRANVTLRQLESEAAAARTVYQDYLGRFDLTASAGALQEPEADMVSAARPPLSRSGPPRAQLLALAGAAALLFGGALAMLLDRRGHGIRSAEQLQAATGLFALGMVPFVRGGPRRQLETKPDTLFSASLGQITNMLRFGGAELRGRVVLVTSAAPGEGKTSFAIALAAKVGREGGHALLIDCDLYKPSVAAALHLDESPTPEPANQEIAPLVRMHRDVAPGLDVLRFEPAAGQWGEANSQALRLLIAETRGHYDMVVLDAPPVLAFADAPVMSLQADGAIMVVRWRSTPILAVTSALRTLRAYGVHVLGGVITQVDVKHLDAADGGHAHLYRNHASYFR